MGVNRADDGATNTKSDSGDYRWAFVQLKQKIELLKINRFGDELQTKMLVCDEVIKNNHAV